MADINKRDEVRAEVLGVLRWLPVDRSLEETEHAADQIVSIFDRAVRSDESEAEIERPSNANR